MERQTASELVNGLRTRMAEMRQALDMAKNVYEDMARDLESLENVLEAKERKDESESEGKDEHELEDEVDDTDEDEHERMRSERSPLQNPVGRSQLDPRLGMALWALEERKKGRGPLAPGHHTPSRRRRSVSPGEALEAGVEFLKYALVESNVDLTDYKNEDSEDSDSSSEASESQEGDSRPRKRKPGRSSAEDSKDEDDQLNSKITNGQALRYISDWGDHTPFTNSHIFYVAYRAWLRGDESGLADFETAEREEIMRKFRLRARYEE